MENKTKLIKNNDVVEFATEMDQIFVDSMPDTRKFIRLALPGEVDGQLPVMTMRFIFQNDEGALFKGLIFPPKGKYTVADLNQLMLINDCGLEGLFYKSYKIKMDKDVKYTPYQQCHQMFNGVIDTVVFKEEKQLPGKFWHHFQDTGSISQTCDSFTTKSGHNALFFDSKRVDFECSAIEECSKEFKRIEEEYAKKCSESITSG